MIKIEKNNTGIMYLNKYKKSENAPVFKGHIKVNDHLYDIALWVSKNNKENYSIKIEEPYKDKTETKIIKDEIDEDFPF